ncbi:MAG: GumC family protein [Paracoccus sp. (in: a-proteobacteria)]
MNDQLKRPLRAEVARPRPAPASAPVPTKDAAEIEWSALLGLVRRRFLSITAITVLLTATALPVVMMMPANYVARTRLIVSQPGYVIPGAEPRVAMNIDTELERMTSRANIETVIAALDLGRFPELNPLGPSLRAELSAQLQSLTGLALAPSPPVADTSQQTLNAFYARMSARRDGPSDIVELSFSATDPRRAAEVANLIVQTYSDQRNEVRRAELAETSDWLTPRINAQQAAYDSAVARARSFQTANRLTATPGTSAPGQAVTALALRGNQLEQAHADLTATLAMISQTADRPVTPLANEPASLTALRTQLLTQQQELAENQAQYGANYGGAAMASERIARTREQIVQAAEAFGLSLQAMLQTTESNMQAVQTQLQQAQSGLSHQNVAELQLAQMLQTVESEAQELAALQRQQRHLQADLDIPVVELEILSPATPPLAPEGHGRKVYLALALCLSGFLAILLAGTRELLDRSVRSIEQIKFSSATVPVGMVPALGRRARRRLKDVISHDPASAYATALRSMIAMIEATDRGVMPASILVCPAADSDEATTLASSLAFALADDGRRVLIVDCHRRNLTPPRLQARLRNDIGPQDPAMPGFVRLTESTGPQARSFADGAKAILEHAAITDSVVIFDAPTVLTSAETLQLAGLVSRTLLVARWGATPRRLVGLAVDRLIMASGTPVLVAMDGVDLRKHARSGFNDAPIAAQLSRVSRRKTAPYPIG